MIDVIPALLIHLKADATVTSLVGTRVYGVEIPAGEVVNQPRKAIVVREAGGTGQRGYLTVSTPRVDVWCYGESPYEARRVRRAVQDALKKLKRKVVSGVAEGNVLLHHLTPSGGPVDLRLPETQWPVVVESWDLLVGEEAVA